MDRVTKIAGECYGRSPAIDCLDAVRRHNAEMVGQLARAKWKAHYRKIRIMRREMGKVMRDSLIYGTGFYRVDADVDGFIQHIPAISVTPEGFDSLEKLTIKGEKL